MIIRQKNIFLIATISSIAFISSGCTGTETTPKVRDNKMHASSENFEQFNDNVLSTPPSAPDKNPSFTFSKPKEPSKFESASASNTQEQDAIRTYIQHEDLKHR